MRRQKKDLPIFLTTEYASVIGSMLIQAIKELGNEEFWFPKKDNKTCGRSKKNGFTLSGRTADMNGGFIMKNGDIEYNYSFESIITVEKEEIQQIAAKILF